MVLGIRKWYRCVSYFDRPISEEEQYRYTDCGIERKISNSDVQLMKQEVKKRCLHYKEVNIHFIVYHLSSVIKN